MFADGTVKMLIGWVVARLAVVRPHDGDMRLSLEQPVGGFHGVGRCAHWKCVVAAAEPRYDP